MPGLLPSHRPITRHVPVPGRASLLGAANQIASTPLQNYVTPVRKGNGARQEPSAPPSEFNPEQQQASSVDRNSRAPPVAEPYVPKPRVGAGVHGESQNPSPAPIHAYEPRSRASVPAGHTVGDSSARPARQRLPDRAQEHHQSREPIIDAELEKTDEMESLTFEDAFVLDAMDLIGPEEDAGERTYFSRKQVALLGSQRVMEITAVYETVARHVADLVSETLEAPDEELSVLLERDEYPRNLKRLLHTTPSRLPPELSHSWRPKPVCEIPTFTSKPTLSTHGQIVAMKKARTAFGIHNGVLPPALLELEYRTPFFTHADSAAGTRQSQNSSLVEATSLSPLPQDRDLPLSLLVPTLPGYARYTKEVRGGAYDRLAPEELNLRESAAIHAAAVTIANNGSLGLEDRQNALSLIWNLSEKPGDSKAPTSAALTQPSQASTTEVSTI